MRDLIAWRNRLTGRPGEVVFELHGFPLFLTLRRGWEVSNPGLSMDFFTFCLAGEIGAEVEAHRYTVSAGHFLWIPAGLPFHLKLHGESGRFARFRLGCKLRKRHVRKSAVCQPNGLMTLAWLELLRTQLGHIQLGETTVELCLALAGLMESLVQPSRPENQQGGLGATERLRIQVWAEGLSPQARPGIADLAQLLNLSSDYSARLFRKSFGGSFEKWIIAHRVQAAAQRLLESRLTVADVAEEYGYSNPFFFSRQFREIMGLSPRQYRELRS